MVDTVANLLHKVRLPDKKLGEHSGTIIAPLQKTFIMGDVKDLAANDAVEKIREIAKDANICMFVTSIQKTPLNGRPMATQEGDDDGNI